MPTSQYWRRAEIGRQINERSLNALAVVDTDTSLAAVSRKLRLLRAHGPMRKLATTHRYLVTDPGRQILSAVVAAPKLVAPHDEIPR